MSAIPRQTISSGSNSDPRCAGVDDKKRKRMISNRESAGRSRMRKQKQEEDFVNAASQLKSENALISQNIDVASRRYMEIESANNVLRAQAMELTERLQSLNSLLQIVEDVSGFGLDIPDPLLRPWQLPCPGQPIVASTDMFQFCA